MRALANLRIFGSILVVVGFFSILHWHMRTGVALSLVGDLMSVPFFLKTRCYDVIALVFLLTTASVTKLMG